MKYRCIRRDYRDGGGRLLYLPMEVGCVYEVFILETSRVSVGGYVFSMGENKEYLRNFEDYFISIEDYRENKFKRVGYMKYRFRGYGNMLGGNTYSGVVTVDFEVDKIYDVRFEKGEDGNVDCYWVSLPYYGKYIDSYWDVEDFEVSFVSIEDIRNSKLDILGI